MFENLLAKAIRQALTLWIPDLLKALLPFIPGANLIGGMLPDFNGALTSARKWEELVDTQILPVLGKFLTAEMAAALRAGKIDTIPGTRTIIDPRTLPQFGSADQWRIDYMDGARNYLNSVPQKLHEEITKEVAKGVNAGESIDQIKKRILKQVGSDADAAWDKRAEKLARTMAADAQNGADVAAALLEQQIVGERLDKVWLATFDLKTRPTHVKANFTRVPVNEYFKVGEASLRWPGDHKTMHLEEIMNCRCALAILYHDDPLPDVEGDQHTERLDGRDSTVVNRRGMTKQQLIEEWRERGWIDW